MLAADSQAVDDGLHADGMTLGAITDALVHAGSHGISFRIGE
jgi:hypothetical protein